MKERGEGGQHFGNCMMWRIEREQVSPRRHGRQIYRSLKSSGFTLIRGDQKFKHGEVFLIRPPVANVFCVVYAAYLSSGMELLRPALRKRLHGDRVVTSHDQYHVACLQLDAAAEAFDGIAELRG